MSTPTHNPARWSRRELLQRGAVYAVVLVRRENGGSGGSGSLPSSQLVSIADVDVATGRDVVEIDGRFHLAGRMRGLPAD